MQLRWRCCQHGADVSLHASLISVHVQCPNLAWAITGLFVSSVSVYRSTQLQDHPVEDVPQLFSLDDDDDDNGGGSDDDDDNNANDHDDAAFPL